MADEKEVVTVPTWGFGPDGAQEIFQLEEGKKLPRGWVDSPAKVKESAPKDETTADETEAE